MTKRILIVDNHSKHTAKITHLFSGNDISLCDGDNFKPEEAELFDLIVFSGGSHVCAADRTKKAYELEIDFIRKAKKPVVGICLGCQLIAKAFGGKLAKLQEKRYGIYEITMNGKQFNVFESHGYTIDKLSNELDLIAKSDTGPEIIKHKTKPIYGFQFHPEVFPRKTAGKKLLISVVKTIL